MVRVLFGFLFLLTSPCMSEESAPYEVVETSGEFEIRRYPDLAVAEVNSARDRDRNFNTLFQFIQGANADQQKIAMTTPVFMQESAETSRMVFVMPQEVAQRGVPEPTNGAVQVTTIPGGLFAVKRYSGSTSAERAAKATEALRAWMKQSGLSADGEPVRAVFNPPWTPDFMRRNEVMIRIELLP